MKIDVSMLERVALTFVNSFEHEKSLTISKLSGF
jgi:hypothetical protein